MSRSKKRNAFNYSKDSFPLEGLGDACAHIIRRYITDIYKRARKHQQLTTNELGLVWKILSLKPGRMAGLVFNKKLKQRAGVINNKAIESKLGVAKDVPGESEAEETKKKEKVSVDELIRQAREEKEAS